MRSTPTPLLAVAMSVTVAFGTLLSHPALAQARDPAGSGAALPAWDALTQEQRDTLVAPLRDRWETSPARRAEMLQRAERWRQMTPEQRQQGRKGMERWRDMSPEARAQMRALHGALRDLPEAERAALRERWKAMTPEQRRAWVAARPTDPAGAPSRQRRDR